MRFPCRLIACLALAAIAAGATTGSGPAAAQSESADGGKRLQALIKELRGEFARGERKQLIDPWYLRDLHKALERYENPWARRLFSDDFSGREPEPDPPWRVVAGEFLIDWRYGPALGGRAAGPGAPDAGETHLQQARHEADLRADSGPSRRQGSDRSHEPYLWACSE